jgi:hypothetical protein
MNATASLNKKRPSRIKFSLIDNKCWALCLGYTGDEKKIIIILITIVIEINLK